MESMGMSVPASFWLGKRVFITGHTGFKGSWLALWLHQAGARVHGYALAPPTTPNLFELARVQSGLESHTVGDIRDATALRHSLQAAAPQVIFHLAAQSLVLESYRAPVETFAINVMGTVNLLEAARAAPGLRALVNVTSDKCYRNSGTASGYLESDALGGDDPYSASKACAELVTAAYRRSYLARAGIALASARAGNVIGGGDWGANRLVPDFLRAALAGTELEVRYPDAVRPWQHVLEPLSGYLLLGQRLFESAERSPGASVDQLWADAWNFGPADEEAISVRQLLEHMTAALPSVRWRAMVGAAAHEATVLKLDTTKARQQLQWQPRWNLVQAIDRTLAWHEAWRSGADVGSICRRQIADYQDTGPVG